MVKKVKKVVKVVKVIKQKVSKLEREPAKDIFIVNRKRDSKMTVSIDKITINNS